MRLDLDNQETVDKLANSGADVLTPIKWGKSYLDVCQECYKKHGFTDDIWLTASEAKEVKICYICRKSMTEADLGDVGR